jgi:hypothetical protein
MFEEGTDWRSGAWSETTRILIGGHGVATHGRASTGRRARSRTSCQSVEKEARRGNEQKARRGKERLSSLIAPPLCHPQAMCLQVRIETVFAQLHEIGCQAQALKLRLSHILAIGIWHGVDPFQGKGSTSHSVVAPVGGLHHIADPSETQANPLKLLVLDSQCPAPHITASSAKLVPRRRWLRVR